MPLAYGIEGRWAAQLSGGIYTAAASNAYTDSPTAEHASPSGPIAARWYTIDAVAASQDAPMAAVAPSADQK